jgi:hypothetical protein
MATKHEWRKQEKALYLPKKKPETITIPPQKFFTIQGEGNPNSEPFAERITVLYSLSYAMKMGLKKDLPQPAGYQDYTVYPLEGVWGLSEKGKAQYDGKVNKDELVYTIMIRQPDFVDEALAQQVIERTKVKKPHPLLDNAKFETIEDGPCVQMMHIGSYDDEPASFALMEAYAEAENLRRLSKQHREIYLKDFRKTPPEKLQTTLRFKVEPKS